MTTRHIPRHRLASLSLAAALAALVLQAQGCRSSVTINEWQKSLEQYAAQEVNHDTAFLRENSMSAPRRHFTILGTATPEKSTDVEGLLLGRKNLEAAGGPWLIFLVGRVKQREVEDIRIALRSDDAGEARWIVGDDDSEAFDAYKAYREKMWRERHPGRKDPPLFAYDFPAEEDRFELEIAKAAIVVKHEASGATWSLPITEEFSTVATK